MLACSIAMLIVPAIFAWNVHNYLRHGELTGKRKAFFLVFYFVMLNAITLGISYVRGIHGLRFSDMTLSYRLKYLGMGCVMALAIPLPVCLLTEDQVSFGGLKRYIMRSFKDLKKYYRYAIRSAKADLRSEVANSYLNWLWWLIEPFCMMLIYTLIFGMIFNASEPYFPIFIFMGLTMWTFFSRGVNSSVGIIKKNKGIITKIYMPKYILMLARLFVNGFKMMVSFAIVALMIIVADVHVTYKVVYFIPIIITFFLFTFGVSVIMMHYGVYINDLAYVVEIILKMLMYFTGIFYSISRRIPEPFGDIMEKFNPVAFLISSMRNLLLYNGDFDWGLWGVWTFVSVVMIALGIFTIYSNENSYVKVI